MNSPQAKLRQVAIDALVARGMTRGEATTAIDKLANIVGNGTGGERPFQSPPKNKRFSDWGKTFRIEHFEELHESENAYLFKIDDREIWMPKSQISEYDGSTLIVTVWIAKKKGLTTQTCH